jgi:hypothetical protein
MANSKRERLDQALFEALQATGTDEATELAAAFTDYTESFSRTMSTAPPLLFDLLSTIGAACEMHIEVSEDK